MTKPEIELSDLYLNLSVETGTSFRSSFKIYSRNGQEVKGTVLSTNDKIVVETREFSGLECEISFYFKGKMAIPGEEHFGDFLLITNGGEWNIPYCITVEPKKMWVMDRSLASLAEFRKFAKENWGKAKEIFFTKEFHDVFFASKDEFHDLYHGLLKGQSKDVILDNFLIEATGKKPVQIIVDEPKAEIQRGLEMEFLISMKGWGHLEGKISSKLGNLNIEKEHFHIEDFEDGKMKILLSLKDGTYEDKLVLETVYQKIEIDVLEAPMTGFRPPAVLKKKKEILPVLLRIYIKLRTGMSSVEEYISSTLAILPEEGNFYELYRLMIATIGSKNSEDPALLAMAKSIEEKRTEYLNDSLCRSFYYYVMSLYKKDRAALMEAAIQIKDSYEKQGKVYDYLLLTMVDKQTALDTKGQCETLGNYLKNGERSPLVYLSLLDVLNREPYYLENMIGLRSDIIAWALKHEYLSLEVSRQFARMSLKEKYFSQKHLKILLKLYDLKNDEIYLKAICSLCIKGNKTDTAYHKYFEDALSKELKIVGLNEYYLRTLDYAAYPELPKSLLYYFHYSNSLDKREKAYLYANILHNKEKYTELLPNYIIRIDEFLREQMAEGRMNRYLLYLYEQALPEILENKEMVKYLPNIIFKKKLVCDNSMMEGVYVSHDEKEEIYVPFVDGKCQVDIFSDSVDLYFVDAKANRYHYGVNYEVIPYLDEEKYRDLCIQYNSKNKKVVLKWLDPLEKGKLSNMFQEEHGVRGWRKEKAVERLLDSHYEEKAMEELSECLDQINYRIINPAYRRTLMNYYMACNRMEDAYFGAELYGSDLMDTSQLYLLTCVGLYLHKEEKDELLLVMAHRSFIGGKYNKDILIYLRQNFEGRNFDMMVLWQKLKQEGLDTVEYEEKLLNQMLFTGEREESILDVLLSYLEKRENDDLTVSMLEMYSIYYFVGRKKVPDSYFAILDRQAGREKGLSFMSRLSYLLYKSEAGYRSEEKELIKGFVEYFCKKHIVFDFYQAFESFVPISPIMKEMTSFYCFAEEKKNTKLLLIVGNQEMEKRNKNVSMEEICSGFYYGKTFLLEDECIREMKVVQQDEIVQCKVNVNKMDSNVKESRKTLLSKLMEENQHGDKMMEQYEMVLCRMKEQLRILT